ncbi:hypothetical protein SAMN05661080_02576 [Modestobacter sp. DSM 44400]|uniref:hypothetical protein n=1 Tax=Modestobacter sp. DSM 44400 TaxID=1550230 RepID=UPI000896E2F9|nr:hypothetical protein [Modestobacter sp. DSM 44400]SDY17717.1 hypothetical protein SAMN05661080_02576 [Modestobacter sp. DSM 44400]
MTNPNEFNDFYGGGGNGPVGRRDYVTSDDVVDAGPQTIDPAYGYAGLVKLANPAQRFAVFAIDFGLLIVGQLILFSAVLPRFAYVEPFSVLYGTAFFATLASVVFAFDCQGVSWGAWIVGVRPVHAVNANGVHGIARVSPWKLVAHDL